MKIGEYDIPDSAIEDAIKASGKRVVEKEDYERKAEAAADLAKFRKVTGDDRSIDEIQKIIHEHEEAQKKNKTQAELALAEANRLEKKTKELEAELTATRLEVKKRDVKSFFEQAMDGTGIKVIEPILEPYRAKFYDLDESKFTPETLKEEVVKALSQAAEIQKGELQRLGLSGISPEENASFGGGMTNFGPMEVKTPARKDITSPMDMFEIMRQTSASPTMAPIFSKVTGQGK